METRTITVSVEVNADIFKSEDLDDVSFTFNKAKEDLHRAVEKEVYKAFRATILRIQEKQPD